MTGGGDDGIIRLPKESEHVITRLEDICGLPDGGIVIADHANGILIYDAHGEPLKHLNGDKDSLAYAVRLLSNENKLVALILDVPGWTLNFYRTTDWTLIEQILLPVDSEISRMKLRWLTVTDAGEIFITAQASIWQLDRTKNEWALIHQDKRKRVWFSHLTQLPLKGPTHFFVCLQGEVLQEITLSQGQGLKTICANVLSRNQVKELGAYAIDKDGNMVISDWATGDILLIDGNSYVPLKQIGSVSSGGEVDQLTIAASGKILAGCRNALEVITFEY